LLDRTTPAAGEALPPSKLGYSGVLVENLSAVAGIPRVIRVLGGRAEVRDGAPEVRQDGGRQLETALLDLAAERGVLDRSTLDRIKGR
jgi:hypothetical protein